jgi:hypothetical protein
MTGCLSISIFKCPADSTRSAPRNWLKVCAWWHASLCSSVEHCNISMYNVAVCVSLSCCCPSQVTHQELCSQLCPCTFSFCCCGSCSCSLSPQTRLCSLGCWLWGWHNIWRVGSLCFGEKVKASKVASMDQARNPARTCLLRPLYTQPGRTRATSGSAARTTSATPRLFLNAGLTAGPLHRGDVLGMPALRWPKCSIATAKQGQPAPTRYTAQ